MSGCMDILLAQSTGQLNEAVILPPQSFSPGAELKVAMPRKICSHMASCKIQKGAPNLIGHS